MTKTTKQSIDYFPLDVDFLTDHKTRRMIRTCGLDATAVLIKLFSSIYKYQGYYINYDEELLFAVADCLNIEEEQVDKIILKAVEYEIFNKEKFAQYNILTSESIQENYFFAVKRRKEVEVSTDYLINNTIDYPGKVKTEKEEGLQPKTTEEMYTSCLHDGYKNEHSIVKDSRGKNKREKKIKKERIVVEEVVVGKNEELRDETIKQLRNGKTTKERIDFVDSTPPPSTTATCGWRFYFKEYLSDLQLAYQALLEDKQYLSQKEKYYPDADIKASLEKMVSEFWITPEAWEYKKKQTQETINWRLTFDRQFHYPQNIVQKNKKEEKRKVIVSAP